MIDFNIGAPYSFRSYNCWHYALDIRKANGIDTELFNPPTLKAAYELIGEKIDSGNHGLIKSLTPKDFDIVIVKSNAEFHCGLYYKGFVMHCSRALKQVVRESLTDFKKNYSECTFWR